MPASTPLPRPFHPPGTRSHHAPRRARRRVLLLVFLGLAAVVAVAAAAGRRLGALDAGPRPLSVRRARWLRERGRPAASDSLCSGIRKPPQAPIAFTATPESITQAVVEAAEGENQTVAQLSDMPVPEATFDNTLLPYLQWENRRSLMFADFSILPLVRADQQALINASQAANPIIAAAGQATYLNQRFYERVTAVSNASANDPRLPLEIQRAISSFPSAFVASGIELVGDNQTRFGNVSLRIQSLERDFNAAVINDNPSVWLTEAELDGTPPEQLASLPRGTGENQGKREVKMQNPDLGTIISHCTNHDTRQKLFLASQNLAPGNVARLEELIERRQEIASLLRYSNYAAYRIESNMAGSPQNVSDFLQDIGGKISPASQNSTAHFRDLKRKDVGQADHLWPWDASYYQRQSNEEEYTLDNDKVREWFPANHTLDLILDLYSHLFGLEFVRVEGQDRDQLAKSGNGSDLVWHPDVQLLAVWDKTELGGGFIGYLYLDLYYRPGKQGGAFMAPITPGFTKPDGSRQYPTAALVCNFRQTDSDTPSLLYRADVQTILHEAGHGMHQLTSKTRFSRFHGPNGCPIDYAEAPSQMMEHYAYTPAALKRFSKHWSYLSPELEEAWKKTHPGQEQPPEQIPDTLIEAVLRNKVAYAGYANMYQVFYASVDLKFHEPETAQAAKDIDTTVEWNKLYTDYVKGIDTPPGKWGHGQSAFTHFAGGYDAGYYAYLWSKSYADDVFYTAFKKDPFSSDTGIRWRRTALEPGGAKDYDTMLTDFLGRESNRKAFFADMGIET